MEAPSVSPFLAMFLAALSALFVFAIRVGVLSVIAFFVVDRGEAGIVAHVCGVEDPRDLKREHCRIIAEPGARWVLAA